MFVSSRVEAPHREAKTARVPLFLLRRGNGACLQERAFREDYPSEWLAWPSIEPHRRQCAANRASVRVTLASTAGPPYRFMPSVFERDDRGSATCFGLSRVEALRAARASQDHPLSPCLEGESADLQGRALVLRSTLRNGWLCAGAKTLVREVNHSSRCDSIGMRMSSPGRGPPP